METWHRPPVELARAAEGEKRSPLTRVRDFTTRRYDQSGPATARLKQAAVSGAYSLRSWWTPRVCTLQQITEAFFEVGGQYRRNV
ncbi:hypothetical protein [Streptomyces sp. B21-083]|uniref:hypothetical protein n=1 Tax=Streptomyces sp. B21-083 TaxID=3039410 RepID=UPI002FF2EA88